MEWTTGRGPHAAAARIDCQRPLGNGDAHAKSFALLSTPAGRRLAPFYDVVSTELYPLLSPTFAMRFGHAERSNALSATDFVRLAKDFGVTPAILRQMVEDACDRMLSELEATLHGTVALTRDPHDGLARLGELVADRVTWVRGLLLGPRRTWRTQHVADTARSHDGR